MNKIVLIGNGFDLAHGMKTSYSDFIDDFENDLKNEFYNRSLNYDEYEDNTDVSVSKEYKYYNPSNYGFKKDLKAFKFNNIFFEYVLNRFMALNYYDLEGFFYEVLKQADINNIDKLNSDFYSFINHLEKYLTKVEDEFIEKNNNSISEISEHIYSPILFNELSQDAKLSLSRKYDAWSINEISRKIATERIYGDFKKVNKSFDSETILLLNFNYTGTADLYKKDKAQTINIHGKLNEAENPIIFGYGDELDSEYSVIENMNDNRFLEHFKSINYAKTENYKQVLEYIDSDLFQVCIMGHSCGNTDRTLLNTIFEHDNCASVKIYYYQKSATQDYYLDVYKNISRNFNSKAKLRDRVVNKSFCKPLISFLE
ncbi:AbiH family protein [uncultured Chryseobacterium sp.]|uniref:AbiH family protein n=1 Tax=uncultured Chryseobacterium sp. TaxID=259322 RepID=UPI00374A12F7